LARVKTNISFPQFTATFAAMNEHFEDMIRSISKGDTSMVEGFFCKPGGRKYLENIILILVNTLPQHYSEKKELYLGFIEVLDRMEHRIRRQKEGTEILRNVYGN
jgi:hypothetical protein